MTAKDSPITPEELIGVLKKLQDRNVTKEELRAITERFGIDLKNGLDSAAANLDASREEAKAQIMMMTNQIKMVVEQMLVEQRMALEQASKDNMEAIKSLPAPNIIVPAPTVHVDGSSFPEFEIKRNAIRFKLPDDKWTEWLTFTSAPTLNIPSPLLTLTNILDENGIAFSHTNPLPVSSDQFVDAGNSAVITSTSHVNGGHNPSSPFTGVNFATTSQGIQECISILTAFDGSGNPISDLGFTFTFKGNPEGITRTITLPNFNAKRLLHTTDWLSNQWTNYQVIMTPSRALVAGETIVIATRHSMLAGNRFLYPFDYEFIESVQTGPINRTVSAGVQPDGGVKNVRAGGRVSGNSTSTLLGSNATYTPTTWVDLDQFIAISAIVNANVPSTSGGLQFQFRVADPTNVDNPPLVTDLPHFIAPRSYAGNSLGASFRVDKPAAKWGRVVYVNATAAQTGSWLLAVNLETSSLSTSVQIAAPENIITARKTVGTSAVQLDSTALTDRLSVEVLMISTNPANSRIFVAFDNTVTTGTGRPVDLGESWRLDLSSVKQIWAIGSTSGLTCQITQIGE